MREESSPPMDDELVPLARVVKESGLPGFRVRLLLGEAGDRLRVYPGKDFRGREDRRTKVYPLSYTLDLLRDHGGERKMRPETEADELVPLDRILRELGWTPNTAKRYLLAAKRLLHTFPDPADNRKKLYPLEHTVSVLRRVHGRVQARRLRMKDEGAGYWTALANLKVAAGRLRKLSIEVSAVSKEVRAAFEGLRRRPPAVVEIYTLPDPDLDLVHPLTVLISPLRQILWRATVPEVPLRGVGSTPEEAVNNLREVLVATFRESRLQPSAETALPQLLSEVIRVRRTRRKTEPSSG
jgi:hypothetical protein